MRLFHIADLHFGKTIYGLSMLEDQRFWMKQCLQLCDERKPDAVLIAGDVYDRASPGGDAVELLDQFLTRLSERSIPVLMIAGNHDSGQRLAFARSMLAREHIHISGSIDLENGKVDHLTMEDPDGYGAVTFWLLPYTYPEQINLALHRRASMEDGLKKDAPEADAAAEGDAPKADAPAETDAPVIDVPAKAGAPAEEDAEPVLRTYDEAIRALLEAQDIDPTHRNVIISHQNVTCDGSEVERGGSETMVGGVGQVDFSVFDPFEYAALGHIHSGYSVGRAQVRYAGTPLCYHFSETRQPNKGVLEIILGEKGEEPRIETLPILPLHKMRRLEGTREEIYELLEKDAGRGEYIGITLTDERITPETAGYLRQLLELRGSRLLELLSSYSAFGSTEQAEVPDAAKERPLEDLFSEFYTLQSGGMPPGEDEYELMRYAAELVMRGDAHMPLEEDAEKLLGFAMQLKGGDQE